MKEWKTIVVVVVVGLLVAAVGYLAYDKNQKEAALEVPVVQAVMTPEETALENLQKRIGQLIVLKEEQTLTRDIMLLQQEIKELNLKAQAPPVIEGELIPMERLPENLQD